MSNEHLVSQIFYRQSLHERLAWGLRKRLMPLAMREVAESMEQVASAIRDALIPALDGVAFAMQRFTVTMLLAEPWYRHLRMRWSLRKARKWS